MDCHKSGKLLGATVLGEPPHLHAFDFQETLALWQRKEKSNHYETLPEGCPQERWTGLSRGRDLTDPYPTLGKGHFSHGRLLWPSCLI